MKNLVLFMVSAVFIFSCMTAKNLPKHNDKYPLEAARYSMEKFPCLPGDTTIVTSSDSAAYLQSIQDLETSLLWLNSVNDSLFELLSNQRDTVHNDTVCRKYAPIVEQLKKQVKELRGRIKNIPPINKIDSIYVPFVDSSCRTALRMALDGEQKTGQEAKEWQWKSKVRFWIIVSLILALFLETYFLIRKR